MKYIKTKIKDVKVGHKLLASDGKSDLEVKKIEKSEYLLLTLSSGEILEVHPEKFVMVRDDFICHGIKVFNDRGIFMGCMECELCKKEIHKAYRTLYKALEIAADQQPVNTIKTSMTKKKVWNWINSAEKIIKRESYETN